MRSIAPKELLINHCWWYKLTQLLLGGSFLVYSFHSYDEAAVLDACLFNSHVGGLTRSMSRLAKTATYEEVCLFMS